MIQVTNDIVRWHGLRSRMLSSQVKYEPTVMRLESETVYDNQSSGLGSMRPSVSSFALVRATAEGESYSTRCLSRSRSQADSSISLILCTAAVSENAMRSNIHGA